MQLRSAILGSTVFFFVAPCIVAGLLPLWISGGRLSAPFPGSQVLAAAGGVLVIGGVSALIASFARFALEGRGTPAPVAPTETLVVRGLYRYVRNPMYVAVLAIILGQAMIFTSVGVLVYGAVIFAVVHTFVVLYEEPTLRRTHGVRFDAYSAAVPRWIPRLSPWQSAP